MRLPFLRSLCSSSISYWMWCLGVRFYHQISAAGSSLLLIALYFVFGQQQKKMLTMLVHNNGNGNGNGDSEVRKIFWWKQNRRINGIVAKHRSFAYVNSFLSHRKWWWWWWYTSLILSIFLIFFFCPVSFRLSFFANRLHFAGSWSGCVV